MAKKATNKETIPSVLAYEKKLVPSDGKMYGVAWNDRESQPGTPLQLQSKSVRGTISNRLKKALESDPAKLDAEVEKANLQTVDHCALPADCDTLKLHFTMKVLSGVQTPSACNLESFQETCEAAIQKYSQETGFTELGMRYAMNLANARFLWRNRVGAENIQVVVKVANDPAGKSWTFDAKQLSMHDFDQVPDSVKELGELIAACLSGQQEFCLLDIVAYAQVGKNQEVYPSEELITEKGDKSKVLYHSDGIASMHSQKLGNAIRTIDTWYHSEAKRPIAIEAYGAVTNLGVAYRKPTDKTDFYTLFDSFALGGELSSDQQHYVMAMLVRGGVFGKSSK